ncbi:unnamed protein product [Pieris brassicae]|uniref:PLAC domain-containing protein n=1 Tax=Pieris brassicae TaxID=7116 RepID=A0A9P0TK75_PIEBR|nr:unnamed protein product [Pieris brassicae]
MLRIALLLISVQSLLLVASGPYNGLHIPSECTDNPFFADCTLVVRSKFCNHNFYSQFCCKSCIESGQVDPMRTLNHHEDDYWN